MFAKCLKSAPWSTAITGGFACNLQYELAKESLAEKQRDSNLARPLRLTRVRCARVNPNPPPGQKPPVGKFSLVFGLIAAGRAFAPPMRKAITTEVGGHVESLCGRGCCFRSFCRVLQPTRYLACALFDVDVDGTRLRLPLSLDGSRSQPSPYEVCLGRK